MLYNSPKKEKNLIKKIKKNEQLFPAVLGQLEINVKILGSGWRADMKGVVAAGCKVGSNR